MDKSAGGQLEILHHPARKDDPLHGVIRIDKHASVADAVKAFVVECRPGEIGLAEIAGRDVDAAQAQFIFRSDRHHLQLDAWKRSEEHTSELQSPCNLVCR